MLPSRRQLPPPPLRLGATRTLTASARVAVASSAASLPALAHAEEAQQRFGVGAVGRDRDRVDVGGAEQAVARAPRLRRCACELLAQPTIAGVDDVALAALELLELDETDVRQRRLPRVVEHDRD